MTPEGRQPWIFMPPVKWDGTVSCSLILEGDEEKSIKAFLDTLRARFGITVVVTPFSPYDSRHELDVNGARILLVDDSFGPYLWASEKDASVLVKLVDDLEADFGRS